MSDLSGRVCSRCGGPREADAFCSICPVPPDSTVGTLREGRVRSPDRYWLSGDFSSRAVRPRAPGDAPHEVNLPGYRHADDGTLCRTAVRTGPADPVCSCVSTPARRKS